MSRDAEIVALRSEVKVLQRQVNKLLKLNGVQDPEIEDLEFQEIIDQCARTLDFRPLQDYQRRHIAKGKAKGVAA